jgi:hypothetical protein
MQELFKALAQFTPTQLFLTLAALTPFVAGIWAALRWAYDTRLKNLETALSDFRTDFDRRLARELSKLTDEHEHLVRQLAAELADATSRASRSEATAREYESNAEHQESELIRRRDHLARAEREFVDLFDGVFEGQLLSVRATAYLASNPTLIEAVTFSLAQVGDLRRRADSGEHDAAYVIGRLLYTGRWLRDGVLQPNKEQGLALINWAAERHHPPAVTFRRDRAG